MSKRSELIQRMLSQPTDFTWHELEKLLSGFGYKAVRHGKTGGSRVRFVHSKHPAILLHKPHPTPVLKRYQLEDIVNLLKQEGFV